MATVDIATEHAVNGLQIGLVAIYGELDAIGERRAIVHERHRAIAVPPSDQPRHDPLAVGIERGPVSSVWAGRILPLSIRDVLCFEYVKLQISSH